MRHMMATPLLIAIRKQHAPQEWVQDAVQCLCEARADVNAAHDGNTPLFAAADEGYPDVARYLCDSRADLDSGPGSTPLLAAVSANDLDVVRLLCERRADLNRSSHRCSTPGNTSSAPSGATPMSLAVQQGSLDIIRCLCNAGASVNACAQDGQTPLLLAVRRARAVEVRLLCEARADPSMRDSQGATPMMVARSLQKGEAGEICRILEQLGSSSTPGQAESPIVAKGSHAKANAQPFWGMAVGAGAPSNWWEVAAAQFGSEEDEDALRY
eukprot:gnl/TRDRNA2_/TRDRNA2_168815_c0_seq2.p1 gnl/TRDRNA2_/TRDRNA2_168815_c0~~gnl/TRDRNA2_/TRDRNA2_168815_c0_seq2.p1  ORF type:complete len:270 (-),score=42.59 gnl/TRDRNA2_/TRDRNA2_168815_c0_seq2:70-879(-)